MFIVVLKRAIDLSEHLSVGVKFILVNGINGSHESTHSHVWALRVLLEVEEKNVTTIAAACSLVKRKVKHDPERRYEKNGGLTS